METETADELKYFLRTNAFPHSVATENRKRVLRRKADQFFLTDGMLFAHGRKRAEGTRPSVRVIVDGQDTTEILTALHVREGGGHFGENATIRKVSDRYYWPHLTRDVKEFVKGCDACQRQNAPNKPTVAELHPLPITKRPFSRWGIDLVGPLHPTARGNRYICTLTEHHTRWAEAFAIPNKEATTVADCIMSVIARYGVMKTLLSDQGREFVNKLNECLCQRLGIKRAIASAYHPETNGLTERFNATICTTLRKIGDETDWDLKIDSALFAYRVSIQDSLRISPFEMLYGVRARLPVELDHLTEPDVNPDTEKGEEWSSPDPEEVAEIFSAMKETIESVRENGMENLKKAQDKQKATYNLKRSGPAYNVGDKVLVKNVRQDQRKGGKQEDKWLGWYTILDVLPKGTYRLTDKHGRDLKQIFNAAKLKRFIETQSQTVESELENVPDSNPHEKTDYEDDLKEGVWLTDNTMNRAQELLNANLGELEYQTPLLGQGSLEFTAVASESMQLLHNGAAHWVLAVCSGSRVQLFDSLSMPITDQLKRQLRQLYATLIDSNGQLLVTRVPVQQQENANDCGVFAIAFAFALLCQTDIDMRRIRFDTAPMRSHLLRCLRESVVEPFETVRYSKRGPLPREVIVTL